MVVPPFLSSIGARSLSSSERFVLEVAHDGFIDLLQARFCGSSFQSLVKEGEILDSLRAGLCHSSKGLCRFLIFAGFLGYVSSHGSLYNQIPAKKHGCYDMNSFVTYRALQKLKNSATFSIPAGLIHFQFYPLPLIGKMHLRFYRYVHQFKQHKSIWIVP